MQFQIILYTRQGGFKVQYGWIKLYRTITEHWLWEDKPFSKGQAWIDMLLMANHDEKKFLLGNEIVTVERGSFVTSELKLMERWGWSKSKVRNFLKMLEDEQMIIKNSDKKKTTITIVNYSNYQDTETTKEPQKDHEETTKKPQKDTNKNIKNDKKDIYNISSKEDILSSSGDNPPYQEIVNLYNSIVKSLPQVKMLSDKRKKTIKANWNKHKNIELFKEVFQKAEESDFLSGRNGKWVGCNFDWLINYNNFLKVLEGTYDNQVKGGKQDDGFCTRENNRRKSEGSTYDYDKFFA